MLFHFGRYLRPAVLKWGLIFDSVLFRWVGVFLNRGFGTSGKWCWIIETWIFAKTHQELVASLVVCLILEMFFTGLDSAFASKETLLSLLSLFADDTPLEELVLLPFVPVEPFSLFWNKKSGSCYMKSKQFSDFGMSQQKSVQICIRVDQF